MPKKEAKSKKEIETTLAGIEKTFGKGSVMLMKDDVQDYEEGIIPTGSIILDMALGIGGLPKRRIVEIFGAESAGKTTLALSAVSQVQKQGGNAAYIDVEHALDPSYSGKIGIDLDKLLVSQPDSAEQALEITEYLVKSGNIDLVVVDSVAALVPTAEIEGQMGELQIGLQARLMSQALRKLTGTIRKTNCTAIFINQLREKVGVVFGNPETTPGGRALKFYSSVRIDLRRIEPIKNGTEDLDLSSNNVDGDMTQAIAKTNERIDNLIGGENKEQNNGNLVSANKPNVTEATLKLASAPLPFVKVIKNNQLSTSPKSYNGLPPEIAAMIS